MINLLSQKILKITKGNYDITIIQNFDFIIIQVGHNYELKYYDNNFLNVQEKDISFKEENNEGFIYIRNKKYKLEKKHYTPQDIIKLKNEFMIEKKKLYNIINTYQNENNKLRMEINEKEKLNEKNLNITIKHKSHSQLKKTIRYLSIFPSGQFISLGNEIQIWDKTFNPLITLDLPEAENLNEIFIVNDNYFLLYYYDIVKYFKVNKIFQRELKTKLNTKINSISVFSNENEFIISTEKGLFKLDSEENLKLFGLEEQIKFSLIIEDSNLLISTGMDKIIVRNLNNFSIKQNINKNGDYIYQVDKDKILITEKNKKLFRIYEYSDLFKEKKKIELEKYFDDVLILDDYILFRGIYEISSSVYIYDKKTLNKNVRIEIGLDKVSYKFLKIKGKNTFINYTLQGKEISIYKIEVERNNQSIID